MRFCGPILLEQGPVVDYFMDNLVRLKAAVLPTY